MIERDHQWLSSGCCGCGVAAHGLFNAGFAGAAHGLFNAGFSGATGAALAAHGLFKPVGAATGAGVAGIAAGAAQGLFRDCGALLTFIYPASLQKRLASWLRQGRLPALQASLLEEPTVAG